MFGVHDLWIFVLSALLLNITPGPDTLYIVGRSSSQGLRAGALAALGIGAGALVHVSAAALGLSAILAASATAFTVVKWVGAAYLLYVGVGLIRSSGATSAGAVTDDRTLSLRGVFLQGFFTNVLNPKVALFFLAFLPQFVDPSRGAVAFQIAFLGLLFTVMGLTSDALYALVAGTAGRWVKGNAHFLRWERYVTGGVFIGLGVTAAIAGNGRR